MQAHGRSLGAAVLAAALWAGVAYAQVLRPPVAVAAPVSAPATPLALFGPLYAEVELRRLFSDSKTFADATPRRDPAAIVAAFRAGAPWDDTRLKAFVDANFAPPTPPAVLAADQRPPTSPPEPLLQHIARLWPLLTRPAATPAPGSSALPLPDPYVVPGGRFREMYYWDSYFTMLGLVRDGQGALAHDMIDDFGSLIDRYGHVPNGTRTYYVSRSQPPFLFEMMGLVPAATPADSKRRLQWLQAEHAFWMAGADGLKPGQARAHVVGLPDGAVLNRYFDPSATPRDESYREDVELAAVSGRGTDLYLDIRAAAESGWDFSSRWLADGRRLATIHTTDLVEPDLNALLYGMERTIATDCRQAGDTTCADVYDRQAVARAAAMQRWLWDEAGGVYRDYDWKAGKLSPHDSASTLYPLFTGAAPASAAPRIAAFVRARLLAPGGLRTTPVVTGQQWDAPNGWAPLQWIAVQGLKRYGEGGLAHDIACRWEATVQRSYAETGRLTEKYDLDRAVPGGGGEYPGQDGFGWTNGVTAALAGEDCPAA